MKDEFLNDEIWILTFGGGFQRANIYKNLTVSTEVRKEFRKALRDQIEKLVNDQYQERVDGDKHIENIQSLVDFTKNNPFGGSPIAINFGIAQKLLNLYLKYSWCSGRIKSIPVHFPVDRLIQGKLNQEAEELKIPTRKLKAWTQFKNEEEYKNVIKFAKEIMEKKYSNKDNITLAEMELEIFQRR